MGNFWHELPPPPVDAQADGNEGQPRHYILLDAAQIDRYSSRFADARDVIAAQPLLGQPLAPERHDATPHLLHVSAPQSLLSIARKLATAEASHGALTWLVSPLPLAELARRLKRRLDITLPDQLGCMNRYYDGRVAPHLHAALTPEQRRDFFSVARQWLVIGPDDQWLSLACEYAAEDPFSGPLVVNTGQEARIIDGCYPYAIIEHFERTDPELLDTLPPAGRYAFIRDALEAARQFGIESGSEATLFCTLAMTRGMDFYRQAEWKDGLEQIRQGQSRLADVLRAQHP